MELRGPGFTRAAARFLYAQYLLTCKRQEIRRVLKTDPRLFNARYHSDYFCMSVFYNQEIDRHAFIAPLQVEKLMNEGVVIDEKEVA